MLHEVEKLGQLPAACQVEPAVSSSRSSSTVSVHPSRARWYSALQPTAPPPMTTTRAWVFIEQLAGTPASADGRASTLHPFARRVIERAQRNPCRDALRGDLPLVVAGTKPLSAHRRARVSNVAKTQ